MCEGWGRRRGRPPPGCAAASPPQPRPAQRNSRESSTPGIAQMAAGAQAEEGAGRAPGGRAPPPRKKWSRPQPGPHSRGEPTAGPGGGTRAGKEKERDFKEKKKSRTRRLNMLISTQRGGYGEIKKIPFSGVGIFKENQR